MSLESIREEVATFCDAFFILYYFFCLVYLFIFFIGPLQMNTLQSVSVACAAVSAITVYHYLVVLSSLMLLVYSLTPSKGNDPLFFAWDQLAHINFTAKQNSMVAVSSLIIICSIIEIILAVAAIRSSDIGGQSSQEQQVREVDNYQILESNKLDISALST